jgi:hypothetical protein
VNAREQTVAVVDLVAEIRRRQVGSTAAKLSGQSGGPTLNVHSSYSGAGASTVSVALADVMAARGADGATVVDLSDEDAFGVGAAIEARADVGLRGWTGGRRGGVRVVRLGGSPETADRIKGRVVVDAGVGDWMLGLDVLVVRATVPGILRAESVLACRPARAIAAVAAAKWPSAVRACLGPRLNVMDAEGRIVFFPNESGLSINGLSAEPLPTSTIRAAQRLLDLLDQDLAESDRNGARA